MFEKTEFAASIAVGISMTIFVLVLFVLLAVFSSAFVSYDVNSHLEDFTELGVVLEDYDTRLSQFDGALDEEEIRAEFSHELEGLFSELSVFEERLAYGE
ncbi:MAG: hypothetical protein COU08_03995 [Candidatus Harrisonbacteria bacterium CG10_big_fil_rev_8_21_14_0_10_42_17]|uniref:Uncharacterized protein n=1 Tax=Candidatus Harrisonbacteria bacterium CG10_big_fil_rev_8_21_14_0_10_42_17 TaxID=1974584 RepID=A0A2M6WH73_9BACT|nr:MAG: hypothetical protein COU08_03995 [Candidatus Harrisonbacteria bacterium CG10_big_fil_rev_8_21_14_0_10_42_17]